MALKSKILFSIVTLFFITVGCKKNDGQLSSDPKDRYTLEQSELRPFFQKHPEFKPYQKDLEALYAKHANKMIWYDKDGRVDFAEVLFDQTAQLESEGVPVSLPYKSEFDDIFEMRDTKKPSPEDDLMISAMYFFYAKKAISGVDTKQSRSTGWFLPRDKVSYVAYLDTLLKSPDLIKEKDAERFSQYNNLRKALEKYRAIEQKGGWQTIAFSKGKKAFKKGDSDPVIGQVRKRLALSGDLKSDSGSAVFDQELSDAITTFEARRHREFSGIDSDLVADLNIPISERIKTIVVNMERCRWIPSDFEKNKEYVFVNIPEFHLNYVKDSKTALESNVVVGEELNKTVVFSGKMSYLVFAPYWNIPKSIVKKEILPGIEKDKNYLSKHHMEYYNNGRNIRQKPGDENSLGLVKFMFPNTNNIYLHDTPAKALFNKEERALSHGCVRVQKAKELANLILKDDKNWTSEKIDEAMHAKDQTQYSLNRKIPVYLAYFTAWADEHGNVAFFDDIYSRDKRLAGLLYKN
ncbi:L,D-transpeptidase family protein [Flavobacterium silvaticum]|uniref:L,D-transpeptidase family protein n=1 Tax=Flavobacterium silvaticum TaxID=1852020 RepID=A0A972FRW2_9FLAO|nr:L,D-transpeptidase family protein [Flavobacterium silvaticum]NMH27368.1 L,D-transpeptidase family protein [Flavobacterium silvaticum]